MVSKYSGGFYGRKPPGLNQRGFGEGSADRNGPLITLKPPRGARAKARKKGQIQVPLSKEARARLNSDPMWRRVVDCFDGNNVDALTIAMQSGREQAAVIDLAQRMNQNPNALRAVKEVSLPVQVVPHHAPLQEAIDIFDRINSQGTKLTDAELALTHVTAKWPQARRVLKEKMQFCAERGFDFNLTFMTRALVAAVTGRALFELIHPRPLDDLQNGWSTLNKVLDYLMNILPNTAYIHGTEDRNTTNALIPLVTFLARSNGIFADRELALFSLDVGPLHGADRPATRSRSFDHREGSRALGSAPGEHHRTARQDRSEVRRL